MATATVARQSSENNNDPTAADSSTSSSSSSYQDPSTNDLSLITGAILLTADCMGTGILALPADLQTLGRGWGIAFLLLNLPINLYAGTILGRCALFVEERILLKRPDKYNDDDSSDSEEDIRCVDGDENKIERYESGKRTKNNGRKKGYSSVDENDSSLAITTEDEHSDISSHSQENGDNSSVKLNQQRYTDTATFDFVGMTSMLFDEPILPATYEFEEAFDPDDNVSTTDKHRQITYRHPFTKMVLAIYYINLFLVLGNYILVMSHAVSAMAGESNLCIPTAGIIACTLMFAISQLRTMANLGRSVSAVSLVALLIVVVQCLYSLHWVEYDGDEMGIEDSETSANNEIVEEELEQELEQYSSYTTAEVALAKMGSLASIGFAVGSQKLLLNIRHEMADRTKAAPGALSVALTIYGLAYVIVCLLAGPHPPSFLFDAIPSGLGRQVAGFLLWIHVAVSYAINSQAFCSSVDRVVGHRVKFCGLEEKHKFRWGILTALVALSSYLVANAVPFFKDLVALCGAATSIPLTLLIPAIFYRRVQGFPLFFPAVAGHFSFLLVVFSVLFMVIGLIGALGSIDVDWSNKSGPFACH